MGSNFSKIKIGAIFTTVDGESYRKTSELTFDDMAGIEHYIDPFFEKKIGSKAKATNPVEVDTSARIVKDEAPKSKPAKKSGKKSATKKKSSKK